MKKHLGPVIAVCLLLTVMGCGIAERIQNEMAGAESNNSNKTITDKAVETAVGEQTIGVPECDEVMSMLAGFAENPDDNFAVKAGKRMIVNRIRDSIKTSVEENKTDKVQLAKDCRELKTELQKSMSTQTNQNGNSD